jgi:adenylyl cyclase-associated protein
VYIFGCQRAVVYIDSKVKGVRVDTCRDLILFVDSALSGVEIVNSKKVKLQIVKSLPSVAIDKTDGVLVGLSYASRGAQLVTSKSSEMNVTFPTTDKEDADWVRSRVAWRGRCGAAVVQ